MYVHLHLTLLLTEGYILIRAITLLFFYGFFKFTLSYRFFNIIGTSIYDLFVVSSLIFFKVYCLLGDNSVSYNIRL